MAHVFSVENIDTYLMVDEGGDTRHVTLTVTDQEDEPLTFSVEADDLARALITASPAFVEAIVGQVHLALSKLFEEEDDVEETVGL